MAFEPILTPHVRKPDCHTMAFYIPQKNTLFIVSASNKSIEVATDFMGRLKASLNIK